MINDDQHRIEFGHFLRSRRERVHPDEVGIPVGGHRRTSGLRREEVAVLAGISPTWYTYLEQGRKVNPSAQALDGIGRVLRLSSAERQYMDQLVQGPTVEPSIEDNPVAAVNKVVQASAGSAHPVYAVNWLCEILAWNDSVTTWYDDFGASPREERNMLRWMLLNPLARQRFVVWELAARDLVARFRSVSAKRLDDPRYIALVHALCADSAEFRDWWPEHDVHSQQMSTRLMRHPKLGQCLFDLVVLYASGQDQAMVVFHTPVEKV